MRAVPADRLLGALIDGRYRIDRAVGEGGFGTVYAALHLGLGAKVALKVLALPDASAKEAIGRRIGALLYEARTLTRLHHSNIAAALDVGSLPEDGDGARLPYLVMEWCEGPTLKQVLERRAGAPMPLDEAWRLFAPLLDAVAHAHAEGVAHRDLKPGNVILEPLPGGAWRPRIIDFGIAKIVSPDEAAGTGATRTGSGASPFTPRYAAPEQLAGARTGPWTDVYALALVFVELVTGRPAIGDEHDAGLAALDPVRPTPGARGVDVGALEPVLHRALALRPADRYADASALAGAMRAAGGSGSGEPVGPAPAEGSAPRAPPTRAERDGTGPPSSHTLRTGSGERGAGHDTPPARRTRRRGVAAVASLALLGALGLGARMGVKGAVGRSMVHGVHGVHGDHGALRDVPDDELGRRVQALGLGACTNAGTRPATVYACPRGSVEIMRAQYGAISREDVRGVVNDLALAFVPAFGAAGYAIDDTRAVIVATRPEDADRALDALIGDATVEVRARAETLKAPPLSAAARAALGAWTGTDLWAAAALASERVLGVYASTDPATATIEQGGKLGMTNLYRKNARAVLDLLSHPVRTPFAYALDGDTLLLVLGDPAFANVAFVRKLLGGAHVDEVAAFVPP